MGRSGGTGWNAWCGGGKAYNKLGLIHRYKDVRPHLIRAGQLVPEEQAERRVLMLINPKMGAFLSPNIFILLVHCWL